MPAFTLQSLIRPHLLTVKPYSSARDEYTGRVGVFLDANENALGSTAVSGNFSRYPDPHQTALKQRIATVKGLRPDQIFLGNGSDEAIDLLIRLLCRPGQDNILIAPPTYGMYEVSARINDVAVLRVPLTADFQLDTPALLAAVTPHTRLIWLCSPNNPSGNLLDPAAIRHVLDAAQTAVVVLDEAYIDFTAAPSWTTELDRYPNLVVLQTFSKAWGLAALRLGMAVGSAELIGWLDKIKPPYNIPAPTQKLALEALAHQAAKDWMVADLNGERATLPEKLRSLPGVQHVYPSDANFLLVRFADAAATFRHLIQHQVIVRDRSAQPGCTGCLRITVGTASENERLLAVLSLPVTP
jgi:histidinol-phosphate aminotransferase